MGRCLGLDVGQKRTGVALSDPLNCFAQPLTTLKSQPKKQFLKDLQALIATHQVTQIVIGLPHTTHGTLSSTATEIQELGQALAEATHLPVTYVDERYTSKIAEARLREQGIKASENKALIDQQAACVILQDFLDRKAP